jgi:hypothetical protein
MQIDNAILRRQLLQTAVFVLIALTSLSEKSWGKSGSVSVSSPANNTTVSSNFTANIGYNLGWVNGIQDTTSTCGLVNPYDGTQTGKLQKLDFFYNAANNTYAVAKLMYAVDSNNPSAVRDMLSTDNALVPVSTGFEI